MYAYHRPVENEFLVRERDRRSSWELLALLAAITLPSCVIFFAIRANVEVVQLGYQIERAQTQRESLMERNRQLQIEKASLSSLGRVDEIARGKLGLVPASPTQVIQIQDSGLGLAAPVPARPKPRLPEVRADFIGPPAPISTEEGF